jgi:hypothetical protein
MEAVVVQSRNILDHLPLAQEHNLNREIIYLAPVPSAVIITRNADIELAAREVALAKSSYHLSSSPGLIMVDEFMVDRFVAVLEKEISSQVQISTKEKEASVGAAGFEKKGGKIKKINDNAVLLIGKAEWKYASLPPLLPPSCPNIRQKSEEFPTFITQKRRTRHPPYNKYGSLPLNIHKHVRTSIPPFPISSPNHTF